MMRQLPYTVQKLLALRSGQEMTYYRGQFEQDIEACRSRPGQPGAPKYAELLRFIRREAENLAARGDIILNKEHVPQRPWSPAFIKYIAIGA